MATIPVIQKEPLLDSKATSLVREGSKGAVPARVWERIGNLPQFLNLAIASQATQTGCPVRVKSGRDALKFRCPLDPRKRTLDRSRRMSGLGQKQTFRRLLDMIDSVPKGPQVRAMTMRLPRRQFFHLAASAAALPAAVNIARAEIYPSRPVRIIVGFPAGGLTDILARLLARSLSEGSGFAEVGSVPKSMTPADFGKFIAEDTEKWGKVIRADNIKAE
jgi:hypothetical protein